VKSGSLLNRRLLSITCTILILISYASSSNIDQLQQKENRVETFNKGVGLFVGRPIFEVDVLKWNVVGPQI
jgi:hypothetical protein